MIQKQNAEPIDTTVGRTLLKSSSCSENKKEKRKWHELSLRSRYSCRRVCRLKYTSMSRMMVDP